MVVTVAATMAVSMIVVVMVMVMFAHGVLDLADPL
jgi:hypothetical protein